MYRSLRRGFDARTTSNQPYSYFYVGCNIMIISARRLIRSFITYTEHIKYHFCQVISNARLNTYKIRFNTLVLKVNGLHIHREPFRGRHCNVSGLWERYRPRVGNSEKWSRRVLPKRQRQKDKSIVVAKMKHDVWADITRGNHHTVIFCIWVVTSYKRKQKYYGH